MRRVVISIVASAGLLVSGGVAAGHEGVTAGSMSFVVGWGTEPAYAGFMNSVQLRISENGRPVTDIPAGAIKVEVATGDDKTTLPLAPHFRVGVFGDPGDYRAFLVPTRAGTYTFTFTGTARGQRVNVKVTSGPDTFDDIANPNEIQFPDKHPSAGELGARLEREVPRLAGGVRSADDAAGSAKLFGYLGLGVGVVALVLAIAAFSRSRA